MRHGDVASVAENWLATKHELARRPDDLLFPISGRVPDGKERKTHKMMRLDLEAAREKWLKEAATEAEREVRMKTDFLSL
jgi:hypothetical protein